MEVGEWKDEQSCVVAELGQSLRDKEVQYKELENEKETVNYGISVHPGMMKKSGVGAPSYILAAEPPRGFGRSPK